MDCPDGVKVLYFTYQSKTRSGEHKHISDSGLVGRLYFKMHCFVQTHLRFESKNAAKNAFPIGWLHIYAK
eukprot:6196600-Pleurochrysis_carterae.AAC.2